MISVILSRHATKDLHALPDDAGRRIYARLRTLAENPRPPGCLKIEGTEDTCRIRVGDYRALYKIDDNAQTVLILRVQHRKDACRNI